MPDLSTASAPIALFPRAMVRPTAQPALDRWSERLAIARDAAGIVWVVGLAAAPTAFTIAVTLDALGLRVL